MNHLLKTIVALFICFSISTAAQAQSYSNYSYSMPTTSYEIYNVNSYGLQNITPSQSVRTNYNGNLEIYNHNSYGLKDISPTQTIQQNYNGNLEIYNHNSYGLKELYPTQIIKTNNTYNW